MATRPPEPELVFELPLALILGLVVFSLVLGYVNGSAGISTVATTIAALVPVLIGVFTWVGTYSVSFRTAVPSTEKVNSLVDAVEEAQSVTIGGGAILYELSQNQSPAKTSQLSTTQATTALAE